MNDIPKELIDWVHKHGEGYTPQILPTDIARGKVGECFDYCTVVALGEHYSYVEGLALRPGSTDDWMLHAWLTDGWENMAYDPTWRAFDFAGEDIAVPTTYIGVELAVKDVTKFMLDTRYSGVLANAWRNPELARKCHKDILSIKI